MAQRLSIKILLILKFVLPFVPVALIYLCFVVQGYYLYRFCLNIPYYDDWRYFLPGAPHHMPKNLNLNWLFQPVNDTLYVTGKLFDFILFKLSNANFVFIHLSVYFIFFGLVLFFYIRLILRSCTVYSDFVKAASILLLLLTFDKNAYWGWQAVAYHQMIPIFCFPIMVFIIFSKLNRIFQVVLFAIVSFLAGLSYISGPTVLFGLSIGIFIYSLKSREKRPFFFLSLVIGILTLFIHLYLSKLFSVNLTHTNRPLTFPWEFRYWVFLVAIYGKAFGSHFSSPWFLNFIWFFLLNLPVVFVLKNSRKDFKFLELTYLSLSISLFLYCAMVSFGRTQMYPFFNYKQLTRFSQIRFYNWWIFWQIPFAFLIYVKYLKNFDWFVKHKNLIVCSFAIFILFPKSNPKHFIQRYNYLDYYRHIYRLKREGMRCIKHRKRDGNPLECPSINPFDLTRMIEDEDNQNLSFLKVWKK